MKAAAMKTIHVKDAVGSVLCHDITRIVPGGDKGPVFRKGHIVREEDIQTLLEVGKEHLYVYEPQEGVLHENEAARRIAAATAGANITLSEPKEGRINYSASCMGLLRVDVPTLTRINSLGEITLATLHSMQQVRPGQNLAGTRVVPLLIEESKIVALEQLVSRPVVEVLPLQKFKVGIVTTGSEVYTGRIKDAFGPVLRDKFARLECTVMDQVFTSDEVEMTSSAISGFIRQGADMVVVTGGMSVDPDDKTPASIRAAGAQVVSYGAPVYPGAMFLLGYFEDGTPICGLPGCVMYAGRQLSAHEIQTLNTLLARRAAGKVDAIPQAAIHKNGDQPHQNKKRRQTVGIMPHTYEIYFCLLAEYMKTHARTPRILKLEIHPTTDTHQPGG